MFSAPASCRMAAGSPGLTWAAAWALTAPARAAMTASSVSRSCFMYPLAVSTRFGIRSCRRVSCTSIWAKAFL